MKEDYKQRLLVDETIEDISKFHAIFSKAMTEAIKEIHKGILMYWQEAMEREFQETLIADAIEQTLATAVKLPQLPTDYSGIRKANRKTAKRKID